MKILKKIGIVIVLILVVAQFFGPEKNEGNLDSVEMFIAETKPPADVRKILETTCYDCHSSKTNYPWYNNITPVNFWLADHVKDGKKHFNFSTWSTYSLKKKEHKMEELHEEVAEKKMPLDSYTWTHGDANLTEAQIDAVVSWGKKVQVDYQQQLNTK
ncbi:heme-binding domain-containing protein [Polaribacter sp. Z014]|uniref:heme-binding domain-containing protein n=1 Tax=unclassified Polaribacter TaxID=196858 RepID=UPI00193C4CD6|nr:MULTISPECIES: heme-binding domain-containing protein [unclassified Polaribacter]MCL7762358.1 heme-binding domain-containing protein [Polaribacter sp. Z014]QVY64218.1 heme-binding domain-containing protein [Polaribacter sp. Q13]